MSNEVVHDESRKRFVCTIDGLECSVDYDVKGTPPVSLDIYRTFVHPDLRGRGIAESLLAGITAYAVKHGVTIVPNCSYAVTYYRRHPDQASVLAAGVDLENGGSCRVP